MTDEIIKTSQTSKLTEYWIFKLQASQCGKNGFLNVR